MADPRYEAYKSLVRCGRDNKYSNLEINTILSGEEMSSADKGLYTRLVYGTIEKKITLDYIISKFSSKPIEKIDINVLYVLRLGVYQIMFCDRIPDSAACNESVNICKKFAKSAASFVNAVLRNVVRNKNKIEYPRKINKILYLSVKYSVLPEICSLFHEDYGFFNTASIFEAMGRSENTTTLRVNSIKTTRDAIESEFIEKGISYEKTANSPVGIKISTNINSIDAFSRGDLMVQDEASQICTLVLDAKEGETVIDTCACPGGKSFGMAMSMNNKGTIYSFDIHESKLPLIVKGAEQLGIDIIKTECRDGRNPKEELIGKADRVMCDLPCSGYGVMAKKPELRYKDPKMTERLPEIQRDILDASAKYLKIGGTLVFSTCTVLKRENESVYQEFLHNHPNFKPVDFKIGNIESENGCITLFPDTHGCDGFFVAKMMKIE